MTDLLIDPHSLHTAPWPCDGGARVHTVSTYGGRTIRKKWRRCLGSCGGRWFWSTDAVKNRMCRRCSPHAADGGGEGAVPEQSAERVAEAMQKPPIHPPRPPRQASPRQAAAPRAVICGGRRFASAETAADALDLTPKIIRYRCTHGWRGWHHADQPVPSDRNSGLARPVIAEGTRYPSIAAAARALSLSQTAVGDRIKRGWAGYSYDD